MSNAKGGKASNRTSIEDQLESLRTLRAAASSAENDAVAAQLRPYLLHPNNLVVARAADLARDLLLKELLGDLTTVFQQWLQAPAKKDPQCWAKNALSKALHHLGCEDSSVFLAGLATHQFEPTWGGQSDVAGTLRANCAHALVDCREVPHQALQLDLLNLFADKDPAVRAEAVRAMAQSGGDGAILLLRLRALTATVPPEEANVVGHCYSGLLALEGIHAVPFIAQFLERQDDCAGEAAMALGETRTPEALQALLACLHPAPPDENATSSPRRRVFTEASLEPWFARVLLSAIALTRQPAAIETLLQLVAKESAYAEAAIEALATADLGSEVQRSLAALVERLGAGRITRCYQQNFPR